MGNRIHKRHLKKCRDRVEAYYEHVQNLRAAGDLESAVGVPFLYRPDGVGIYDSERHYLVWNMRHSAPPETFTLNGKTYTLSGKLHPEDVSTEFPDLEDAAVIDCTVDEFLEKVVAGVEEAWDGEFTKKKFATIEDSLAQSLDNVCQGDIPFDVVKASTELRKARMWDQHDLSGNPWIVLHDSPTYVKTQRMQNDARKAMVSSEMPFAVLYEGNPNGPGSSSKGVFHATN